MKKFKCIICGHVYDPAEGDPNTNTPPGISFEDLPDDWICPICRVGKEYYVAME